MTAFLCPILILTAQVEPADSANPLQTNAIAIERNTTRSDSDTSGSFADSMMVLATDNLTYIRAANIFHLVHGFPFSLAGIFTCIWWMASGGPVAGFGLIGLIASSVLAGMSVHVISLTDQLIRGMNGEGKPDLDEIAAWSNIAGLTAVLLGGLGFAAAVAAGNTSFYPDVFAPIAAVGYIWSISVIAVGIGSIVNGIHMQGLLTANRFGLPMQNEGNNHAMASHHLPEVNVTPWQASISLRW